MTEALEALERVEKALKAFAHPQITFAGKQCCRDTVFDLGELMAAEFTEALSLLPTLRAALSAEGVGDAEIEAIRGRHEAAERNSRWDDIEHYGDDAHADRATLLRKVDELTRAAKET